jgi:hypothetical protein
MLLINIRIGGIEMTDTFNGKPTSKELEAWADYQRSYGQAPG